MKKQYDISNIAKMNAHREEQPYYLVTDSDLDFIYSCLVTAIYIIVAYMVYYHHETIVKIIAFVVFTNFVLYCMVALFKFLDNIQAQLNEIDPPHFD